MEKKQQPSFKDTIQVPVQHPEVIDYEKEFKETYNNLFEFLSKLDFVQEKYRTIQQTNSLTAKPDSTKKNHPTDLGISDDEIVIIYKYLEKLCKEPFRTLLNSKKIPSRPTKPENFSQLSKEEQKKYNDKLAKTDIKIRLMTYIRELVNNTSLFLDHEFRNYYINLCSFILISYCKTHSNELTEIQFRFKSPKGLIIKTAKNIIISGTYDRSPSLGIDTLRYIPISDAFGTKMVSLKGYSPQASLDPEISGLIDQKNTNLRTLAEFELFLERLDRLKNGESEAIYLQDYFDQCIHCLKELLLLTNSKEKKYIAFLNSQIEKIEIKSDYESKMHTLSTTPLTILNLNSFIKDGIDFRTLCHRYEKMIPSQLNLKGLKKGINIIFNPKDKTSLEILNAFGCKIIEMEDKYTASGHEGVHVEISTPLKPFENQLQNDVQKERDIMGKVTAHTLMPGKKPPIMKIPESYQSLDIPDNSDYPIGNNLYLHKDEVDTFYYNADIITAKKGTITYNHTTEEVKVKLASTLENYKSISTEIPNGPVKDYILQYFKYLESLSFKTKEQLFHHVDPIEKTIDLSDIEAFCTLIPSLVNRFNGVTQDSPLISK